MADATDKMREEFEAWIREDSTLPLDRDAYDYSDFTTALMWHAWQAAREALAQQPAQGEAVDKGPWRAESEHSNPVTGVWVASDDFEHDVRLYVNGDFESQEQRIAYAKRIAEQLNAPPAPSVPDGWRLVPVKQTPKMARAAVDAAVEAGGKGPWFPACYAAMLAAAPEPPR